MKLWQKSGVCGLLAIMPALATPPSETGIHFVHYTLVIDPDASDRVRINLPEALEPDEDAPLTRGTRSPSVFVFDDNIFDPGSNTGWHYHPGIVMRPDSGTSDHHLHHRQGFDIQKIRYQPPPARQISD